MRKIQDINCSEKSVLLIVDYNVGIIDNTIASSFKIDCTVETINFIKSQNPSILYILTHLGRPKSKNENKVDPIYEYLSLIFFGIEFVPIVHFKSKSKGFYFGDNSRYYNKDDLDVFYDSFDFIINDSFGTIHRKNNIRCYAGLLMQKELEILSKLNS